MTQTALQKLLKYPHAAVFDKDPDARLALRLRHSAGATWSIGDEVLSATAAGVTHTYALDQLTVQGLASRLVTDGFQVADVNADFASLSALVLVEGAGDQGLSNGDHVQGFTSLLWALYGGYARQALDMRSAVREALLQMVMPTASGEWLDLWGTLYNVPRKNGEHDADLIERIPREAFRIRVNGIAIEQAIKDETGLDVEIREPWKQMFRLDKSRLSGSDHLHNAEYFTRSLIQPVSTVPIDWAEPLRIINRNRAAGVLVYSPGLDLPPFAIDTTDPSQGVLASQHVLHSLMSYPLRENPLGVMRLDNNSFSRNYEINIFELRSLANDEGLQTEQDMGTRRNVAKAAIALSSGARLGSLNAILSRGNQFVDVQPSAILSGGLALSDYTATRATRRVELHVESLHSYSIDLYPSLPAVDYSNTSVYGAGIEVHEGNTWTGPWDARHWLGWREVGMNIINTSA
jgi:hypothetical protein